MRIDGTLPGWPQWIRVPWLRGMYLPFWRSVNAARRAWRAAFDSRLELLTCDELIELTTPLDQHPNGYGHSCNCAECRSYD